jgi:hypothetical protein
MAQEPAVPIVECKHESTQTEDDLNFIHCMLCGLRRLKIGDGSWSLRPIGMSYGLSDDNKRVGEIIEQVKKQKTKVLTNYTNEEKLAVGPGMIQISESVASIDERYKNTPPPEKTIEFAATITTKANLLAAVRDTTKFNEIFPDEGMMIWCLRCYSPLFRDA